MDHRATREQVGAHGEERACRAPRRSVSPKRARASGPLSASGSARARERVVVERRTAHELVATAIPHRVGSKPDSVQAADERRRCCSRRPGRSRSRPPPAPRSLRCARNRALRRPRGDRRATVPRAGGPRGRPTPPLRCVREWCARGASSSSRRTRRSRASRGPRRRDRHRGPYGLRRSLRTGQRARRSGRPDGRRRRSTHRRRRASQEDDVRVLALGAVERFRVPRPLRRRRRGVATEPKRPSACASSCANATGSTPGPSERTEMTVGRTVGGDAARRWPAAGARATARRDGEAGVLLEQGVEDVRVELEELAVPNGLTVADRGSPVRSASSPSAAPAPSSRSTRRRPRLVRQHAQPPAREQGRAGRRHRPCGRRPRSPRRGRYAGAACSSRASRSRRRGARRQQTVRISRAGIRTHLLLSSAGIWLARAWRALSASASSATASVEHLAEDRR